MMTEREFATEVVARLQKAGYQALWAGGCVRDEILGLPPADYDVATDARPEQVQALFRRSHGIGAAFGVVEVLGPRGADGVWLKVQVATFRSDGTYSDGRRPDFVTYSSPEEDAKRRDFTINGMFFDPIARRVIDYVGGQTDLNARLLRAIGNPAERFAEDKLRVIRAARMAARFELTIDAATMTAARRAAPEIVVVSAERVADELRKILTNRHRARGFRLLREFELIAPVLPELLPTFDLPQGLPAAPTGTLWDHTVKVLEALEGPLWPAPGAVSFPLAFAAVLHDVGKPRVVGRTPDRYTFHGHEHVGARMTAEIAKRLRLSNAEAARLTWLVERHQYLSDAPTMRPSRLKPILIHPGIGELLALHRADAIATGRNTAHVDFCERVLRETPPEELNPAPAVTGDDLIAIGLKPGPEFKRILDAVREAQLEGRIKTKEDGLRLAEEMMGKADREQQE
ncbi:CCA tRNA nucleotidyltransferase [Fimbriiglobus ruber]|uniref:tRNA nucleotidyltransferase n=1 Tax=Fimbriiglobus ruber TaxID=1908690 RepID=A0A225DRQ3_9BACT|nr:CCA tRNA nucleotidyltransferase [Fimbriiglobus ruber]OWK40256.1 tRNA nucleotidyltransferase [Fimbriiglobus ruber]